MTRPYLFCRADRLTNFVEVAERFDHDQVCPRFRQGSNLLREGGTRLLGLNASKGSDPHPKRTDIPCDQHFPKRCRYNAFR